MKRITLLFSMILALSAVASAQNSQTCPPGIDSIRGTYLVSYSGWLTIPGSGYVTPTLFPGVILGVMSIDSDGNISGNSTLAGLSEVAEYESTGQMTLKPDCIGIMKLTNKNKNSGYVDTEVDKFIVVSKGNDMEIHVISTSVPGVVPVFLGKWTRIAYKTNAAIW